MDAGEYIELVACGAVGRCGDGIIVVSFCAFTSITPIISIAAPKIANDNIILVRAYYFQIIHLQDNSESHLLASLYILGQNMSQDYHKPNSLSDHRYFWLFLVLDHKLVDCYRLEHLSQRNEFLYVVHTVCMYSKYR